MQNDPHPIGIQRILVCHMNLHERCMQGKSLSENSTQEEIGQQILFYYKYCEGEDSIEPTQQETSLALDSNLAEAVQFLGLCTALHGLPNSLGAECPRTENDSTNEIYFGKSTLIFVSLEESEDILAVVQVARPKSHDDKMRAGCHPSAIRSSLLRSHRLFCMIKGGGIVPRLSSRRYAPLPVDLASTGCPYPGMDRLYDLWQSKRQYVRKQQQNRIHQDAKTDTTEMQHIENEIRKFKSQLPIADLRTDLATHYMEYVNHYILIGKHGAGAHRCLTDVTPPPKSAQRARSRTSLLPSMSAYTSISLGLSMRRLLLASHSGTNVLKLNGVSLFYQGHHLITHLQDNLLEQDITKEGGSQQGNATLSNEDISVISKYISAFRLKMKRLPDFPSVGRDQGLQSIPQLGLRRLSLEFVRDEAPNLLRQDRFRMDDRHGDRGTFLPPPPASVLGPSEEVKQWEGSHGELIWVIPLDLSLFVMGKEQQGSSVGSLKTDAIVYDDCECSFLVFVDSTSHHQQGDSAQMKDFLMQLKRDLSDSIDLASEYLPKHKKSEEQIMREKMDPGQDVVVVDHEEYCSTILSDKLEGFGQHETKAANTKKVHRKFLGFGAKSEGRKQHNLKEWDTDGLDSRHQLASQIHYEVVLAFDDMIDEITKHRQTGSPHRLELCTSMSLGWIYALSDGKYELYAFFDSSSYVTVEDVQDASQKLKAGFLGDWVPRPGQKSN